ncbi:XrtA/PEP-CTERM system exopolysaccharide export protein [Nitrogeniibacter mangrovi]|nr:XrtA/PEP-CTERM system exopolysaccharide export protein [Nitrogeniibacter mangrovi]
MKAKQSLFGMMSAFLAVLLLLAGCATNSFPPAPAMAADADYNYVIGPGDTVNIVVWRNPELSMSVPVRPDGKITTPLVEDLPAIGKDATTLARDIEKALEKYIREPVVTVIVTSFVGPYSQQIRVVGEAAEPKVLPYRQKMTLLDVMIAVGGLTEFADGNHATILRTAEGNKQYSVRLDDLLKDGDVSANAEVRPGDVLIIPQSWF